MGEKSARDGKRSFSNGTGRLVSISVPAGNQRKQTVESHPSFWEICSRWLHYHGTQLRWDIERFLARRLHRRWGIK